MAKKGDFWLNSDKVNLQIDQNYYLLASNISIWVGTRIFRILWFIDLLFYWRVFQFRLICVKISEEQAIFCLKKPK